MARCKSKKLEEFLDDELAHLKKNPFNGVKFTKEDRAKILNSLRVQLERPLSKEELNIFNVSVGEKKSAEIKTSTLDGLRILLREGTRDDGMKHIIKRHFGENGDKNGGRIDYIDIIKIGDIIRSSEPTLQNNGRYKFSMVLDAKKYLVIVDKSENMGFVYTLYTDDKFDVNEVGDLNDTTLKTDQFVDSDTTLDSGTSTSSTSSKGSMTRKGFVNSDIFNLPYAKYKEWIESNVDRGFDFLSEKLEVLNEKFDSHNMLTTSKAQKDLHNIVKEYEIESNNIYTQAGELKSSLEGLHKDDGENIVRALNGDLDPFELSDNHKAIYDRFRDVIDKNADELVEAGALNEKSRVQDYVKRYYEKHLETQSLVSKMFTHKRFEKRKNLTYDERIALGMVEDASFVIPKTIAEQKAQLLKANTLKSIADRFAKDEEFEGSVLVSNESVGGGIFKYGALAGKYVRADIFKSVNEAQLAGDVMSGFGRAWFQLIDHIKVNVTVKNPVTHLYNIGSNVLLAGLNGDLVHLAKVMHMAKSDKKGFNDLLTKANKHGLNSSRDDYEGLGAVLDNEKPNVLKTIMSNLYLTQSSKAGKGVRKLYDWEDKIFKLASMKRHLDDGKSELDAYNLASEVYVDYSTPLPTAVKMVDKSGVMPFLHYVWKSTPATTKVIAKNPIKYIVMQSAMVTLGASALFNENDDDYKPKWAEDKANLFGTKEWVNLGNGYYLNAGRMIPAMKFGGLDLSFDTGFGFVGGAVNIAQGKTPLGYDIAGKYDSGLEKLTKKSLALMENYLPPLTFGRYGQRTAQVALSEAGVLDKPKKNYYDEDMSIAEIAQRGVGVRRFNEEKELQEKATEANTVRKYKNKTEPKAKRVTEKAYRETMSKLKTSARQKGKKLVDKKKKKSTGRVSIKPRFNI
ncbi:MAG: hypothetical protein GQ570_15060 [Helicobacteraceae bacterium]|nr:hypothetical protein [Helicobacteraceae bacterium]